jgi:hypothetical protein
MAPRSSARAAAPRDRMLALFDFAGDWFDGREFRGCMFIRAAGEFTEGDDPVRAACAEHNRLIDAVSRGLAEQAGAPDPSLSPATDAAVPGRAVGGAEPRATPMASTARRAAATLVSTRTSRARGPERPPSRGVTRAG